MAFKEPQTLLDHGVKLIQTQPLLLKRPFLLITALNSSKTGELLLKNCKCLTLETERFLSPHFPVDSRRQTPMPASSITQVLPHALFPLDNRITSKANNPKNLISSKRWEFLEGLLKTTLGEVSRNQIVHLSYPKAELKYIHVLLSRWFA